jgi:hypothetical protein
MKSLRNVLLGSLLLLSGAVRAEEEADDGERVGGPGRLLDLGWR